MFPECYLLSFSLCPPCPGMVFWGEAVTKQCIGWEEAPTGSTATIHYMSCFSEPIVWFWCWGLCQNPGLSFVRSWGCSEMIWSNSDSYQGRQRGLHIRDQSQAFENVQNWERMQKSLLTHTSNRMFAFQQRGLINVAVDYVAPLICYWFSNTKIIASPKEDSC